MQDFIGERRLAWVSGRTGTRDVGKPLQRDIPENITPKPNLAAAQFAARAAVFARLSFLLRIGPPTPDAELRLSFRRLCTR